MKIVVLGGDGFCGWPTSLHLSNLGHDVLIADNLSRRRIDPELSTDSLTPISPIQKRIEAEQNELRATARGVNGLRLRRWRRLHPCTERRVTANYGAPLLKTVATVTARCPGPPAVSRAVSVWRCLLGGGIALRCHCRGGCFEGFKRPAQRRQQNPKPDGVRTHGQEFRRIEKFCQQNGKHE